MPARKYEGDLVQRRRQAYLAWKAKSPKHTASLARIRQKRMKTKDLAHVLFTKARDRARLKKLVFAISIEDVRSLIAPMKCNKTGHTLSLDWKVSGENPWGPSLDRIDSARGYELDNVQVVSWIYNRCKGQWSDEVVRQFRGPGI